MPVDKIRRGAAPTKVGFPNANSIRVDTSTDTVRFGTGTSGSTEKQIVDTTSTQTLSGKTLTTPTLNGPAVANATYPNTAVLSATASTLALTAALHAGRVVTLNRAGGVAVTLPAATGTGNIYRLGIGTALSAASHTIAVASATDFMRGLIFSKDDGTASSVIAWATANTGTLGTESDTITLDGSTKGGNLGDIIELEDVGAALWRVTGFTKSSGTEVTPFSAAV